MSLLFHWKTIKKRQVVFFYMSEYEIRRSLAPWKRMESTSYLVVGSQRVKKILRVANWNRKKLANTYRWQT